MASGMKRAPLDTQDLDHQGMVRTATTAEAVVAALECNGLEQIFCLPGVQNDPLFDVLFEASERIRVIHTRHEQGCAYMALGAALATGEPSAYCVVPGPGFLNTTTALATAYSANAPVLALIGQIPSAHIDGGLGLLHDSASARRHALADQMVGAGARADRGARPGRLGLPPDVERAAATSRSRWDRPCSSRAAAPSIWTAMP